jgi:general secretion pathway protein D
MIRRLFFNLAAVGLPLLLAPTTLSAQSDHVTPSDAGPAHVSSTIVTSAQTYPTTPLVQNAPRAGNVSLNFPAVDVHDLAKAVLGDMLNVPYQVESSVAGSVTLVTAKPIAREEVLRAFEDALHTANLALIRRGGSYVIAPIAEARAQASEVGPNDPGYGSETITLKFIAASELKRLLDPVIPDTLSVADPTRNVITVTGAAGQRRSVHDLIAQFDTDWLRGMSFALYVPRHTDARLIVPEIEKLLNGPGSPSAGLVRLITMDRINGVLAIASQPEYLEDVKRWIEVLDREGESSERRLYVYRVENGRSSDLAHALVAAFGGGAGAAPSNTPPPAASSFDIDVPAAPAPGAATGAKTTAQTAPQNSGPGDATITSDETNNAVLIYGTPSQYAVIEDALRQLDIAPVQVVIEAAVTEVTLTHDLQYGVQWNFRARGGNAFSLLQNNGTVASPSSDISSSTATSVSGFINNPQETPPGFSYLYTGASITATLNALSGLTTVNVLSAPKLLVLNNHTASLEVGDQVPVVTASSVSTIGTNSPQVNSVDYRDTGVILKVTPRVNSGGLVLLDISQEVSDVTQTSTSSINSPTIEQRRFSTSVAVQDGQTIALGGLIRDSHSKGRSGIPFLSAIPILGALAGNQTSGDNRTELLILLTPHVVRSTSDADSVTDELRRKIQAIEPLRPIKSIRP